MAPGPSQIIQWQVLVFLFLAGHVASQRLQWKQPDGTPPDGLPLLENATEGDNVWCCFKAINVDTGSPLVHPITYTVDSTHFEIGGPNKDALVLRAPFDREETATIKLQVSANTKTSSGDPVQLDKDVYLFIVDVNDNAPVFTKPGANGAGHKEFFTEIKEDTPVGTTFYVDKMWGIDRDASSTFSRIVFSCDADGDQKKGNNSAEAKLACDTFSISTHQLTGNGNFSARFTLLKKLNFRQNEQYIMTVMLNDFNTDGSVKHEVNALLLIRVLDIQNENPFFYLPIITVNLKDGTKKDHMVTQVQAQDRDMENPIDKNPVVFSILKVVPALDNGFGLLDFNCTADQLFPESYCAAVITKDTIDREKHANVSTYEIYVLAKEIDKASGKYLGYNATCQIIVNIIDINDNAPLIVPATKTVSIAEGRDDAFLTLQVGDLDLPENGRFNLSLVQPYSAFKLIPQNPHVGRAIAQISVADQKKIDYEVPSYRTQVIKVIAEEYGEKDTVSPLHTTTGTYTINIIDENDNAPKFPQANYIANVKENSPAGTTVITITATDADSSAFGPLTYKIEGDSKQRFAINPLTGLVTVKGGAGNIDYEDEAKFNIFIVATDKGKKEVTVKLEINVIDQNDVNPIFEKAVYRTKVTEKETTMNPQVTVSATDDETKQVFYSIIDGNTKDNAFVVDRNTGKLTLNRPLNYAEAPAGTRGVFTLTIEANDGGTPPGKSNATVRVQVLDVNDFAPVFNQTTYTGSVSETAAPEFPVLRVKATDQDGGPNGEFNYRIAAGSQDQFMIRQDGWITLATRQTLDYNLRNQYEMVVHAIDQGAPQKTGTCQVIIKIIDVNNKPPTFNPNVYFTSISADAKTDHLIKMLQADDQDTNSKLEYKIPWSSFLVQNVNKQVITGSPILDQVTVDSTTGRVHLRRNLRPEQASTFQFSVTAEDVNAVPPNTQTATATILVNIFRSEGETPVFNSPWSPQNPILTQFIPEEQGIGTLVLQLSARDPLTKERLYDFVKVAGSDPNGFFTVTQATGEVRLAKRVDYETINPKVIRCEVVVTTVDKKRNATALIIVNVRDINDNSPTFALQEFTFSTLENSPYRSIVGNVRATDKDSGNFGQIAYTLTGGNSQDFMIDQGTGDILVAGRLNRESFPKYQLLVIAVDNPSATQDRKSGIATVTINLLDVNDNSPQFEEAEYKMYTMESAPVDTSLGKVLATDKDEGINSQIFYSILGGNSLGFFKIDQLRGVIRTARSLQGHARGAPYPVIVEAIDNGIPNRLRSLTTVQITIQDPQAFIGRPSFINPTPGMVVSILEEQPVGSFVLTSRATDSDGPDSAIRYSFTASNNPDHAKFRIDPVSGNITTAEVLDREKQSHYDLQIQAKDATGNISAIMLGVRLIDIDDHPPSFYDCNNDAKNPLTGSVHENEAPPEFVLTVLACDLDANPNNLLFFKITCGNELDHFTIGLRDGAIHTKTSLDREKISQYNLCVTVYSADPGTARKKRQAKPVRSSSIGVRIEVLDRDDNGPTYAFVPDKTFTTGLLINAAYNSLVIDAHAMDPDTAPNSVTFYRLINMQFMSGGQMRSAPGVFQVDMTTGEIRTSIASYSDYTNGRFELSIEAYDTLGRKDNATVLIYVLTQSQRLKFIFTKTPGDVRSITQTFMSDVSYVVKARITTDLIRFSVGDAADFDFQKTDVCFHMVKDNDIVLYTDAVTLLSPSKPELKKIYDTYGMTAIGLCNIGVKTYTRYTEISFWWVIIVLALFLFIFILICILVILCLWNRYRRFMLTNTSRIVRMEGEGNLLSNEVVMSTDITTSKLTTNEMTKTDRTSKISYDEVDISLPVPAPMVSSTETTVVTKTEDGYTNYGYDNQETSVMSPFGLYEDPATMTTTTTEQTTSDVVGGTVAVTGGVVGGESTTTVTKETNYLDVSGGSDMRTINAGGTPTVLRKVVTTTTTVTEEMVEEPASPTPGVVITEVTTPAEPIDESDGLYATVQF